MLGRIKGLQMLRPTLAISANKITRDFSDERFLATSDIQQNVSMNGILSQHSMPFIEWHTVATQYAIYRVADFRNTVSHLSNGILSQHSMPFIEWQTVGTQYAIYRVAYCRNTVCHLSNDLLSQHSMPFIEWHNVATAYNINMPVGQ